MLDKIKRVLLTEGGGAGIRMKCDSSDLSIPVSVNVLVFNGKMKLNNIDSFGDFPLAVEKFSAEGYYDGMSDVRGDVLVLTGSFGNDFKVKLQEQIQKVLSGMNEDIFKAATPKDVERRRKKMPLTIDFSIDSYSGELSTVVGGYYSRPGAKGLSFTWNEVGVNASMNTGETDYDLEGFTIDITCELNKDGMRWWNAVFNPPPFDPKDYEGNEDDSVSEEMHWDMYWEDVKMNWGV